MGREVNGKDGREGREGKGSEKGWGATTTKQRGASREVIWIL